MITLYQLHWSHYVEKVRWALDYKGLAWRAVEVEPFSKREMLHLSLRKRLDLDRAPREPLVVERPAHLLDVVRPVQLIQRDQKIE